MREPTTFEPLRIQTEPGAIPVERPGAHAIPADEEKHIAIEGVSMQALRHQCAEPVKPFPHIGRLGIRIDGHPAAVPSHRSSFSNWAAPSTVKPSTRGPATVMWTATVPFVSTNVTESITATGRN